MFSLSVRAGRAEDWIMTTLRAALVSLSLLALAACGDGSDSAAGACENSILKGSWSGTVGGQTDTLTFKADCTGTSAVCQATFTYPNVTATSGTAQVTVTSTSSAAYCLQAGAHTVTYSVSGSTLTYGISGGTLTFTRQ
jgi:hypothetical protein